MLHIAFDQLDSGAFGAGLYTSSLIERVLACFGADIRSKLCLSADNDGTVDVDKLNAATIRCIFTRVYLGSPFTLASCSFICGLTCGEKPAVRLHLKPGDESAARKTLSLREQNQLAMKNGGKAVGKVTLDEFIELYKKS